MNLEDWKSYVSKLRSYPVESSDHLKIHVRPRHYGSRPDLLLPLYFSPEFYALIGLAIQFPTTFIRETAFIQEAEQKRHIGRTAQYIAVGLLGQNHIDIPVNHTDKIVVTVLVPKSIEAKKAAGIKDADGIVLSYHLNADPITSAEKLKEKMKIAKMRKGRQ